MWLSVSVSNRDMDELHPLLPPGLLENTPCTRLTEESLPSLTGQGEAIVVMSSDPAFRKIAEDLRQLDVPLAVLDSSVDGTDPGELADLSSTCFTINPRALENVQTIVSAGSHLTGHPLCEALEPLLKSDPMPLPALLRGKNVWNGPQQDGSPADKCVHVDSLSYAKVLSMLTAGATLYTDRSEYVLEAAALGANVATHEGKPLTLGANAFGDGLAAVRITEIIVHTFMHENNPT